MGGTYAYVVKFACPIVVYSEIIIWKYQCYLLYSLGPKRKAILVLIDRGTVENKEFIEVAKFCLELVHAGYPLGVQLNFSRLRGAEQRSSKEGLGRPYLGK